jgi:hypothetical protein
LGCLLRAVEGADATLAGVLDGFERKLTYAKWAALGKCSADTALRDINDMLARGVLRRLEGGGGVRGMNFVQSSVRIQACAKATNHPTSFGPSQTCHKRSPRDGL